MNPFDGFLHISKKTTNTPYGKVKRIKEWAEEAGLQKLGILFENILVKEVRNAFYHSDYVLYEEEFRIIQGEGVKINNMIDRSVKLKWLVPKIELAINSMLVIIQLVQEYIASYTEPKILKGRIGPDGSYEDVELLIENGYGVTGFQSPPKKV